MASTSLPRVNGLAQLFQIEEETPHSTPTFQRRPESFSSSSRSNSWDFGSSPLISFNESELYYSPPYSPIISPLNFIGIPFSWEQTPGIPKNFKKKESSGRRLLPLPPAGNSSSAAKKFHRKEEIFSKKHQRNNGLKRDPFFAALVECSKDYDDHGTNILKGGFKITRSLSDRIGFINMYASCKTTCAVSESIVHLPRPNPHYLLHQQRRRSS